MISVNFFKNEKYVLSTSSDKIILPSIDITNIDTMTYDIKNYIKNLFINISASHINNIRFISFNDDKVKVLFSDDKNTIHIHYGGTLPNLELASQYWVPFDYMDLNIQKELSVINNTIQHVI